MCRKKVHVLKTFPLFRRRLRLTGTTTSLSECQIELSRGNQHHHGSQHGNPQIRPDDRQYHPGQEKEQWDYEKRDTHDPVFCNIGIKRVTGKPQGENCKSRKTGENGWGGHLAGWNRCNRIYLWRLSLICLKNAFSAGLRMWSGSRNARTADAVWHRYRRRNIRPPAAKDQALCRARWRDSLRAWLLPFHPTFCPLEIFLAHFILPNVQMSRKRRKQQSGYDCKKWLVKPL